MKISISLSHIVMNLIIQLSGYLLNKQNFKVSNMYV
jgi:hypothetical protein